MDDYLKAHREGIAAAARKAAPKNPDDIPPRNLQDAEDEKIRKKEDKAPTTKTEMGKPLFGNTDIKEKIRKLGGRLVEMKKGGKVGSASKRADGIAKKGKTRGRFV
jgi:hypothetical protein